MDSVEVTWNFFEAHSLLCKRRNRMIKKWLFHGFSCRLLALAFTSIISQETDTHSFLKIYFLNTRLFVTLSFSLSLSLRKASMFKHRRLESVFLARLLKEVSKEEAILFHLESQSVNTVVFREWRWRGRRRSRQLIAQEKRSMLLGNHG